MSCGYHPALSSTAAKLILPLALLSSTTELGKIQYVLKVNMNNINNLLVPGLEKLKM